MVGGVGVGGTRRLVGHSRRSHESIADPLDERVNITETVFNLGAYSNLTVIIPSTWLYYVRLFGAFPQHGFMQNRSVLSRSQKYVGP